LAKRDKPHTIVLMGPFLDGNNEDIARADICYQDPSTNELEFLDYDELFQQLLTYLHKELTAARVTTKVVLIPSAREINHISPLP